MVQPTPGPDFQTEINRVVNYFVHAARGGFLFCACDPTAVIPGLINVIIERSRLKNLDLKKLNLSFEDVDFLMKKIREAAETKPDGIIFSNLDELIVLTKDRIINNFNLARDRLLELNIPFLFCVTRENMSKFTNMAQDIFSRRGKSVIYLPEVPVGAIIEKPKEFHAVEYLPLDIKNINLKIELLEKQLNEGERRKYKPGRIANEIAPDLIHLYLHASLIDKANELFEKYRPWFDLKNNIKTIEITAYLYYKNARWESALEFYDKIREYYEQSRDFARLGPIINNIGLIYMKTGQLQKAFDLFSRGMEVDKHGGFQGITAYFFNNIGGVYNRKGQWDKALEYYLKARTILEGIQDEAAIEAVNENIRAIRSSAA